MNKKESKFFSTAARMDEALIEILEKKDFEFITVKEICNRAGVNRSTFYLHYENTYDLLLQGGAEGLRLLVSIVPALVLLLTAVHMLKASGAVEILSSLFAPVFSLFGIPPETAMLVLIRPISGSAALAVWADLMARYGPDSFVGRTVAVMLGSTETTFYTISVYFGAAGIQKTRYTVFAALIADFVGFFMASLTARLFFP